MEKDCVFCKIAAGQTDTTLLFENERIVVFRDIRPHAPTHLLIVPKKHIRSVNDATEADQAVLGELFLTAQKMARQENVADSGYKLQVNVEKGGGQVIFHLHLHLLGGWNRK
ncbi:histidine triad nucleotide-binding protein [Desulfosarcina sp. OttesenSCG-928-G10]|nr:histidine triad nucleotide-binding protein [Desulfosarcina sp. OttesenSCG-928-G10]